MVTDCSYKSRTSMKCFHLIPQLAIQMAFSLFVLTYFFFKYLKKIRISEIAFYFFATTHLEGTLMRTVTVK